MNDASPIPKTEVAYLRLKTDLLSGKLSGGDPLRIEALQSAYQIGTTPIREALARLEIEGFVELRPNRGYFATSLSAEDFADLIYSRLAIERALLVRAIERGNDEWESRVITAHHFLKKSQVDLANLDLLQLEQWEERHVAFHIALLSGSGASRMLSFYRGLFDHLRRHQMALMIMPMVNIARKNAPDAVELVEELRHGMAIEAHTALMEAVFNRDIERALNLLEDHIKLTPWQLGPEAVSP